MKIEIVNDPNLNLLRQRESEIYDLSSFDEYHRKTKTQNPDIMISHYQNNVDSEQINKMQEMSFSHDGDKQIYYNTYEMAPLSVRSGGFFIADNTLWEGQVVNPVYSCDGQILILKKLHKLNVNLS